jgi:hypothetical protein
MKTFVIVIAVAAAITHRFQKTQCLSSVPAARGSSWLPRLARRKMSRAARPPAVCRVRLRTG